MHMPTTGDMGDCTDISENTAYPKQLLSNRAYKKEDMKPYQTTRPRKANNIFLIEISTKEKLLHFLGREVNVNSTKEN